MNKIYMRCKGIMVSGAVIMFVGMCFFNGKIPFVYADDAGEAKLLQKIDALEKRLQVLEDEKSQKTATGSAVTKSDVEQIVDEKVSQAAGFKLPEALKDITLSGFVDTSYEYSFNRPDSGTNTGRVFDTESNSFGLRAAKIALEKLPAKTGGVGFRTDFLVGEDAKVLNSATNGFGDMGHFDLEQAYLDIIAPIGRGLEIKAGKFVTLAGAEVIESKDNWNFSRSLLFGYAIPFTHTGIRAIYPFTDTLTGYLGVNNGWDNVKDNNKAKSFEYSLAWAPKSWLSFNLVGLTGREVDSALDNSSKNRQLIDFVTTYQPFTNLTFKLNTDYVCESEAMGPDKNGTWSGIAGYVRYDINDKWSLSNRTEYFSDPNGLRFAVGTNENLWENTSTLELRPFKNLITRLEYRYDHSTSDVFTIGSKAVNHQSTIGAEAIYAF